MSSKVLSYSFSKQSDPQNDLDMRPQVMTMIQKFLNKTYLYNQMNQVKINQLNFK